MMSFSAKVYKVVQRIPAGTVATYKDIAAQAGSPKAARAVGDAMRRNPDAATIPCHRVVGSDGALHGYAFGGAARKRAKLEAEGVRFKGDKVDLATSRWLSTPPA